MTTTVRDRDTRRADELKVGDWLAAEQLAEDGDRPTEVLGVHPFTDTDGTAVLLIYRTADGRPDATPADAHQPFELATEAEVDEAADDVRRDRIATQLRMLADLMVSKRLPIPGPYNIAHVTFNFGRHIEQVDRVAELLGIEREIAYGTATVKLPAAEGLLSIGWDAYAPKAEPKPLVDPDASMEAHYDAEGDAQAYLGEMHAKAAEVRAARADAAQLGLLYTREADDPTPVSPARVPAHVGAVTDDGLIDETECYVPNGFQAPEVIAERTAACKARHPGRECVTPTTP